MKFHAACDCREAYFRKLEKVVEYVERYAPKGIPKLDKLLASLRKKECHCGNTTPHGGADCLPK